MEYPDGSFYEGEWADNIQNGYGKMYYADDTYYEGEWVNG